jgi:hypothetical protein
MCRLFMNYGSAEMVISQQDLKARLHVRFLACGFEVCAFFVVCRLPLDSCSQGPVLLNFYGSNLRVFEIG